MELHALPDGQEWRGCLTVVRDRDTIDALEIDLREATRFRGLSWLYMGAMHALRAPLNAMSLNLELLKHSLNEESAASDQRHEQRSGFMNVIGNELKRLSITDGVAGANQTQQRST